MTEREENAALWEALEEWVFRYRWRADGMNVEQARIHARAFVTEAKAKFTRTVADTLLTE